MLLRRLNGSSLQDVGRDSSQDLFIDLVQDVAF
jgi:hypothetical protein